MEHGPIVIEATTPLTDEELGYTKTPIEKVRYVLVIENYGHYMNPWICDLTLLNEADHGQKVYKEAILRGVADAKIYKQKDGEGYIHGKTVFDCSLTGQDFHGRPKGVPDTDMMPVHHVIDCIVEISYDSSKCLHKFVVLPKDSKWQAWSLSTKPQPGDKVWYFMI